MRSSSARSPRFLLPLAFSLALPLQALADWGENWGTMYWRSSTAPVPGLDVLGVGLLVALLMAASAGILRKWRPASGLPLLLVVLAIPLAVAAGTLTVPSIFVNGTVADADQVNASFDAVKTQVNDNDSRITTAQSAADAAAAGHTVDTNTQLTPAEVAAAAAAQGFVTGAHTTNTNTQLTNAEVAAAAAQGFVTGAHTTDTNTQLDQAAVDAFVANNGFADAVEVNARLTALEAMFLTTDACPAGYNAVEDGYIKLGATGLTTTASSRTLSNPGHGHSHSLQNAPYGGFQGAGTLGLGGDGDDLSLNFPLRSNGAHNHTITGTVGAAGVAGDTPQDITGDLEHITLRLCVRSS